MPNCSAKLEFLKELERPPGLASYKQIYGRCYEAAEADFNNSMYSEKQGVLVRVQPPDGSDEQYANAGARVARLSIAPSSMQAQKSTRAKGGRGSQTPAMCVQAWLKARLR